MISCYRDDIRFEIEDVRKRSVNFLDTGDFAVKISVLASRIRMLVMEKEVIMEVEGTDTDNILEQANFHLSDVYRPPYTIYHLTKE